MTGRRGIAAVLFLARQGIAWGSDAGVLEAPRTAKIHIWLVDRAGLPEKLRSAVEAAAAGIFRKAGLRLDFVDCLSAPARPCLQAPGEADFWLQILAGWLQDSHADAAGFTVLAPSERAADSYAAVSYATVEVAAHQLDVPVADVLAAAMAHEIGHLLLHSPAHSQSGIMSPRLERRHIHLLESGHLLFTREEAALLKERARRPDSRPSESEADVQVRPVWP